MNGLTAYSVGYDAGRHDEQIADHQREVVHQIFYGRPHRVTVDQSYIDRLHAALATANDASRHNYAASNRLLGEALDWKQKAQQFKNEALYWRDEKYEPARARSKARREENEVLQKEIAALRDENAKLLALLKGRDSAVAKQHAAHNETFQEKQSLHRFRLIATWLIDAFRAGRSDRPEFTELLTTAKTAADTIERGDLFTAFGDEPEKYKRLCALAESLQKP